jgi:hypothetical protein
MSDRRLGRSGNELPPEGSAYWEELAGRIDAAVADRGARSELAWLGAHGARLGGAGLVAAALLVAWVLARPSSEQGGRMASTAPAAWRRSIAPSDSLGRTLAVDQPPALGAFILAASRSGAGSAERGP